jgi:hypothetical protein
MRRTRLAAPPLRALLRPPHPPRLLLLLLLPLLLLPLLLLCTAAAAAPAGPGPAGRERTERTERTESATESAEKMAEKMKKMEKMEEAGEAGETGKTDVGRDSPLPPPPPPPPSPPSPPLIEMSLSLSGGGQAEGASRPVALEVFAGGSTHDALWDFAMQYSVGSDSLLRLKQQLDARARSLDARAQGGGGGGGSEGEGEGAALLRHPSGAKFETLHAAALHQKARKDLDKGRYRRAARHLLHAVPRRNGDLPDGGIPDYLAPELSRAIDAGNAVAKLGALECPAVAAYEARSTESDVDAASSKAKATAYLDLLHSLQSKSPKNGSFPLWRAQCYAQRRRFAAAQRACGEVLQVTGSRGRWRDEAPRTLAVILASRMSLELGDVEAASKKLSVALRADPSAEAIKRAFNQLKKIRKHIKSAAKDLDKTYNKRALEALHEALKLTTAYDLKTGALRGKLMMNICIATARVRRHEQALIDCNEAIELSKVELDGLFKDTHQVASAYLARGGALLADYDYGEAARDFRRAAELESNPDAKREAQEKQRNAEWRAKEWEKNPDREKILGLPANFGQLNQKSQCAWLKKSYKKMVLKWHPDKNKGNPERGRRKFEEVQTAKAAMAQQLGCKGRRRL